MSGPKRSSGAAGKQQTIPRRPVAAAVCLYGDPASRRTEQAREPRRPRLSAAVLSETLRIVGVEIGVTVSKSIAWPARREQLVRQVRIEQQGSDYFRCGHGTRRE